MLRGTFFGSVAAGFMVGIGGAVFLHCDSRYIGAVMFTVALLSICCMGLYLFTGKIGFIVEDHSKANITAVSVGLAGNFAGTALCALFSYLSDPASAAVANALCSGKLDKTLPAAFFGAILCGVLMYTAVKIYKDGKGLGGVLFCVPVFILSGFEHSIADMYYFWMSGIYTLDSVIFILVVVLGNTVGGCLLPLLEKAAGGNAK